MRRLLGFAIIAGFSFSSFAAAQVADPQSTLGKQLARQVAEGERK